jgi:hypothetical protein
MGRRRHGKHSPQKNNSGRSCCALITDFVEEKTCA